MKIINKKLLEEAKLELDETFNGDFADLLGRTLFRFQKSNDNSELILYFDNFIAYKMLHHQDCCESVLIEDINGDLNGLIGSPILMAEKSTSNQIDSELYESALWTFYKLATIKGYVTIRWLGTSNGYYSEGVDLEKYKIII